jgi:hypothetical protein
MTRTPAIAAATGVALTSVVATALFVGGDKTGPPAAIPTPTVTTLEQGAQFAAVQINWAPSNDATGYRIWLDGKVVGLVNYVNARISVTCNVTHRFNVGPYNNKGFAKLAPPAYLAVACAQ